MRYSTSYAHLRIHHAAEQHVPARSPYLTQRTMDIALILTSLAGLLSAIVFLITMV